MGSPKPILVTRFEIPPEAPFFLRPENEIQHRLACDGIRGHTALPHVDPLRADACHDLSIWMESSTHLDYLLRVAVVDRIASRSQT